MNMARCVNVDQRSIGAAQDHFTELPCSSGTRRRTAARLMTSKFVGMGMLLA